MMGFPLPPPVYSASCSFFSLSVNLSVCSQLSCFHSNDCFVVKTQKVSVWLIISMLKDLLSTLKPPLHITLVVLLFFHSLSVCFSLFLTYRPRQASKGRKTREPTPTELTFKLHPIPPGTKGTAVNIRLNPEICMKKKTVFSCFQKGSKGHWNFIKAPCPSFALTFTSLTEHESNVLQISVL